ncbi:MAG TPA: YceI family protein [Gemmataceae bacterium]|jgi:polyisoprenoid-binding protein YceI|nr:YceI family protein [Gemmataceae bacterium]
MRLLIAAVAAVVFTLPTVAEDKVALTGDNTKITFVGTKPGGKHEGGFKTLKGGAVVSADGLSKVAVEIDMESLFSDDPKLTAHLKSPDFFGVKTNPKSKFESTKIEKSDKGHTITGNLTLNGKTKEISFPATITATGGAVKIESSFSIDKRDFGMEYGGGKIDDKVSIKVSVDAK